MGMLRVIFALAVVFTHSPWSGGPMFMGARNAVQLFYLTSGFLISYVLVERGGYERTGDFYLSRWLRLYPIYGVVALLTLAIYWATNPEFFRLYANIPSSAATALIVSNASLFGQDWIMFTGIDHGRFVFTPDFNVSDFPLWKGLLIPPAWSLGVELCF